MSHHHRLFMDILSSLARVAGLLALVLVNGFFVATEFAIVKVRATQIEPLVRRGVRRAAVAQHVITHLDTYLSATQLGITITSLGLGWFGEPVVSHLLEPLFGLLGIGGHTVTTTISFAVGFTLITFFQITLGELVPRWFAIRNARAVSLRFSPILHVFYLIFRPLIWLLNEGAVLFTRLLGIEPAGEGEVIHSEEELRLLLSRGKTISSTGKTISLKAIELRDRTVREVMVPRTSIVSLSIERTLEENVTLALETQFTRFPLCAENLDNVLGMIHLKDLFKLQGVHGPGSKLQEIKREILFVPETTPLERLLNLFLTKRILMAIAVDEYGGTAGLVTLENVLEELVGEIRDEFDIEPLMVQKVADNEFLVDGRMPLHDFSRMFDIVPESRDVVTVSGYATHLLGRAPEKGATLRMGRWAGTVDAVTGTMVRTLRIKKAVTADDPQAA